MTLTTPAYQSLPFTSRIVPVVELLYLERALPLADALLAGGIDVIEITLRTDAALAAIALLARERPQLTVAAGTVLNEAQLHSVLEAGAKLVFAPGSTASLLQAASNTGVPFLPGVATPSEVMHCLEHGFTAMKLFPADAIQSLKLLKAFTSPLAQARFIPTGGINELNIHDYVVQPNVLAVGASAVAPRDLIERQDWVGITHRAAKLLELAKTV